jgi:hypothetical protein|tara:strand:+ start:9439 stop:10227 length:789 start_codon:yes stop_codon:yes gene_type:complete
MIIFANKRTGSKSVIDWFFKYHKKYVDYNKLGEIVESLGYKVNYEANTTDLFTRDGMFYDVVKHYETHKDISKLEHTIDVIFSYRPTHRIFTEEIHIDVVDAIIRHTNRYHSSILFLHRKKSLNRLLSVWYSKESGMYQPKDIKTHKFKPSQFKPKKLDINYLITNQKYVNKTNLNVWRLLQVYGPRYVAITYEDFFEKGSYGILHLSMRWIFYNTWDFGELQEVGDLGLKDHYKKMIGVKKLEKELEKLKRPVFSNLHVEV